MRKVFRRLGTVLAVVGGVATTVVGAASGPAYAACDEPRVISVNGTRAAEGTAGQRQEHTKFEFTVSSTRCAQPGALRYETVPYTAGRADFVGTVGELTFPAGDLRDQPVAVLVVPDITPEQDECFSVRVVGVAGQLVVGTAEAAGIILDDDRKGSGRITEGFICSE